jgi:hypothetical protein
LDLVVPLTGRVSRGSRGTQIAQDRVVTAPIFSSGRQTLAIARHWRFFSQASYARDQRLGRAIVAVRVARVRVSGRPAVGFVVADVKVRLSTDGANRVALIVGPADIVPLFPDHHAIAGRVDLA